ncbi:MAG: hypothetical protein IPH76_17305 [Xanthomonadales bacterium]|nr:hypothetical protein [Xanthomonadales bacterium]
MTLSDGREVAMPVLNFRATEYTVGAGGPERMPGQLPPTSAYTYAVELSADQALAVGAKRVQFSQPVGLYVDNFLGFPVGQSVPAGWYDFRAGSWAPSDNGRVIKIVGVENALAQIDIDGSGLAATAEALTEMGISGAERARLAQTYAVGAELWRTPLDHLTPWDCNWPYVPPDDVEEPTDPDLEDDPYDDDPANDPDSAEDDDETDDPEKEDCEEGSIYYCKTQSMGLKLPLPGTGNGLSYRSDRISGAAIRTRISLRLTSNTLPGSLRSAAVSFQLLGVRQTRNLTLLPAEGGRQRLQDSKALFDVPTQDAYRRPGWQGAIPYSFELHYRYPARYVAPSRSRAFARFSGSLSTGGLTVTGRGGSEITLTKQWRPESLPLAKSVSWNADGQGMGGWSIDLHQVLDPAAMVVFGGSGGQRKIEPGRAGIGGATLTRSTGGVPLGRLSNRLTPEGGIIALSGHEDADYLYWETLGEQRPDGQWREIARSCIGMLGRSTGETARLPPRAQRFGLRKLAPQPDHRGRILLMDAQGLLRIDRTGRLQRLDSHRDARGGELCVWPSTSDRSIHGPGLPRLRREDLRRRSGWSEPRRRRRRRYRRERSSARSAARRNPGARYRPRRRSDRHRRHTGSPHFCTGPGDDLGRQRTGRLAGGGSASHQPTSRQFARPGRRSRGSPLLYGPGRGQRWTATRNFAGRPDLHPSGWRRAWLGRGRG